MVSFLLRTQKRHPISARYGAVLWVHSLNKGLAFSMWYPCSILYYIWSQYIESLVPAVSARTFSNHIWITFVFAWWHRNIDIGYFLSHRVNVMELWFFFDVSLNKLLNKQWSNYHGALILFFDVSLNKLLNKHWSNFWDLRHFNSCDVTVMYYNHLVQFALLSQPVD